MDYVMITFAAGDEPARDLRVPSYVTVGELMKMLTSTFSLSIHPDHRLQAEPIGRILDNKLTLQEEGIVDGALLTLI